MSTVMPVNTMLTTTERDAIDEALRSVRYIVGAIQLTAEEEGPIIDPCHLPELLGGIERHVARIEESLKAADDRKEQAEKGAPDARA